nr:MAG TPA: hypothetical protein [Caudoviricetes sp.]
MARNKFFRLSFTNYYKKDGVLAHAADRTNDSARESPARAGFLLFTS